MTQPPTPDAANQGQPGARKVNRVSVKRNQAEAGPADATTRIPPQFPPVGRVERADLDRGTYPASATQPTEFPPATPNPTSAPTQSTALDADRNGPNLGQKPGSGRKWVIAAIVVAVLVVIVLGTWVTMLFLGGGSQSARSACTKAASDLQEIISDLKDTRAEAERTLQTDASLLSDASLLDQLKAQYDTSQHEAQVTDCNSSMEAADLAAATNRMLTQEEELRAVVKQLQAAIDAVRGSQNQRDLGQIQSSVEELLQKAEQALVDADNAGVSSDVRAALSAQIDDAKYLLEQISQQGTLSDERATELSNSLNASKDRLNEDLDKIRQAIADKTSENNQKAAQEAQKRAAAEEAARKAEAAEAALKQAEDARKALEEARRQQQPQQPQPHQAPEEHSSATPQPNS